MRTAIGIIADACPGLGRALPKPNRTRTQIVDGSAISIGSLSLQASRRTSAARASSFLATATGPRLACVRFTAIAADEPSRHFRHTTDRALIPSADPELGGELLRRQSAILPPLNSLRPLSRVVRSASQRRPTRTIP